MAAWIPSRRAGWSSSAGLLIGTAALVVTVNVSNLYASVTAMSLGYAFVMSILGPMWSIPAEIAGPKGVGFASGFVNFVGNVGGIGSPILMGVVFQHFHSFTPAILISAGITLVCARAVHSAVSRQGRQGICR